jgi:putative ABC transport system permease protein
MKTRYRKIIGDFTADYLKQSMLVIAMAIGIVGVGSILGAYYVIKRTMADNYLGTVPASATLEVEKALAQSLVDSISHLPGIQAAERHATRMTRMRIGDRWYPLLLFVTDNFRHKQTNKFTSLSGETTPPTGTMLVERSALGVMRAGEGDTLSVMLPHGHPLKMKISGVVHDPALAPAWQEQAGYGYVSMATLRLLDSTSYFNQLRILVSEQPYSRAHITATATEVATWLTQRGYPVHEVKVPAPGQHPHQSQMTTVVTLFIIFSFLVLALGAIVVATAMATVMVKQVRQIGVMKAIGATSRQIAMLYGLMIVIPCLMAAAIAIPISMWIASAFATQLATLLNLEITDSSIPLKVALIQLAAAIGIPLLTAAAPIVRGSRTSVRQALDNYGVGQTIGRIPGWITWRSPLGFVNHTLQLSLRNVFRQRSRLVMTLGLLAAGGAMFMTARNVSAAWDKNLERVYQQRLYDLEIRLDGPADTSRLLPMLRLLPGVRCVEGLQHTAAAFQRHRVFSVTATYPDGGHGSFSIQALPFNTRLLNPTLLEGSWLTADATNKIVLNQIARGMAPGTVNIGDSVSLSIDGNTSVWVIAGFTEDVGTPATAYVSAQAFSKHVSAGPVNVVRVAFHDRSRDHVIQNNERIETLLENEKVLVNAFVPVWLIRNAVAAHMKILVNTLTALAVLMALVGAIGLMSAMSMNVLERTREIGVMRTLGATPAIIRQLIMAESLLIGAFSLAIAFAGSLLLSAYMENLIGNLSFRTPLPFAVSATGSIIWVLILLAGSVLATWYPIRRAQNISTREALAYE